MAPKIARKKNPTPDFPVHKSVQGRAIKTLSFGKRKKTVLLMAGVHGDEKSGVLMIRRLLRKIRAAAPDALKYRIVVMPVVNPDAFSAGTRRNANDIDINRNFPTRDFHANKKRSGGTEPASEPETRAVLDVVERAKPWLIISLHAALACVNYNGDAALKVAKRMSSICKLEVKGDIGYPCPGSMGTYYGWERQLPVITLELPRDGADMKPTECAILDILSLE
ncbi:MAG TPA: DUF2817 domain-containing protein [bacterium]|nr:DUF2817 domain-containing protein [bacterium]